MENIALPAAVTRVLDSTLAYIYSLEVYVAPTVVLVPSFLRVAVAQLSEAIGFDVETLTYTLALFLCYPLGLIMLNLPNGQIRHLFSFLLGAFLMQFAVGVQWIHQLITSLVVYAMFMFLPRKVNKWLVPAFVMIYCVLGHLHRQYVNYLGWDLDFTGTQMVLTQKLYMMAYNLYDGEVIAKGKKDRASEKCSSFALKELPSLLEYLGYAFCFSTVLSGPASEFVTYRNTCDGSLMYDKNGKPKGKIPSNFMPTLKPFLVSIANLIVFVGLGAYFPLLNVFNPQTGTPVVLTAEFLSKPWFYRYAYTWVGLIVVRQKYYFAWMNSEGANNIWYAGFEGFDEKGEAIGWENSSNVDIWKFETAENVQTLSKEWNKKTSLWLTRYVYYRTNGSLVSVYSTSAFWHGFYPGYYMFFLSVPLMTFAERIIKKKISPYFSPKKWTPYGIFGIIMTSVCVEYFVIPFVMLARDRSWDAWKSHYFFGHIACLAVCLVLSQFPTPKAEDKKKTN